MAQNISTFCCAKAKILFHNWCILNATMEKSLTILDALGKSVHFPHLKCSSFPNILRPTGYISQAAKCASCSPLHVLTAARASWGALHRVRSGLDVTVRQLTTWHCQISLFQDSWAYFLHIDPGCVIKHLSTVTLMLKMIVITMQTIKWHGSTSRHWAPQV